MPSTIAGSTMEEVMEAGRGWVEGLGEVCEDVLGGMSLNDCIKGPLSVRCVGCLLAPFPSRPVTSKIQKDRWT